MGIEVSVKLKCGVCGKKIPVKGQIIRHRQKRFGDDVRIDDVLVINYPKKPEFDYDITVQIDKGATVDELEDFEDREDGRKVVCGPTCCLKALNQIVPIMWKMKAKPED